MLRRVKFDKHLLYNCGAFLCDLFLIFLLQNFCKDDVLSYVFGQNLMQLNIYGLYLKLPMLTFTCTFIFVCIIVSVFLPMWRNKGVHKLLIVHAVKIHSGHVTVL